MGALSGTNWNPGLKAFHDRLEATGKKPKVVIVAVMRKMITTLNPMLRDGTALGGPFNGPGRAATPPEPLRRADLPSPSPHPHEWGGGERPALRDPKHTPTPP